MSNIAASNALVATVSFYAKALDLAEHRAATLEQMFAHAHQTRVPDELVAAARDIMILALSDRRELLVKAVERLEHAIHEHDRRVAAAAAARPPGT